MKCPLVIVKLVLAGWAGVCVGGMPGSLGAAEVGSAFNYQGRLLREGVPAHGAFDLQFNLFASEADGLPCAPVQTHLAVNVVEGLFTRDLDFGQDAFTGEACWLEIRVRPSGEEGVFQRLSPRQRLAPAPFSLYTLKAERLAAPLSADQLPSNVARLDAAQTFTGDVTFAGLVHLAGLAGDGQGLTNVTATGLSARLMERMWKVSIPFVTVTNAGNSPDFNGLGSVPHDFRIGKYEINNHQYVAFLRAVAAEDLHGLYDTNMAHSIHGGIVRTGHQGEYAYEVKPGMGHQPVVWVDYYDAMRFCNWLHHGQPTGGQDATTTEDGAYTIGSQIPGTTPDRRNPGARYWLPSGDEWYKAAYHQPYGSGGIPGHYWPFPTRNFDPPVPELPPGGVNSANACCGTGMRATDVGAYENTYSYYGVFDLAGNVQEWTEEIVFSSNLRVRGGSWLYNEFYSESTNFEFDTPDYPADGIGLRVAGAAP